MTKIVNYEVYVDKGTGGWQLVGIFPAEQRQDALEVAKESERGYSKVKVVKETFDDSDNTFQESIEYLGGIKNIVHTPAGQKFVKPSKGAPEKISKEEAAAQDPGATAPLMVVVKAILIIFVCLLLVNFLVTLISPIIEAYAPEELAGPIVFAVFFITFLSVSIPLLLKKVPWYVFATQKGSSGAQQKERKIYSQAESIVKWYNLNSDTDPTIASVHPEAPLEYKKDTLSFLAEIISYLQTVTSLKDSFSKLGVKLVIYGGCLELSRASNLHILQANSLLFEAFKIIDGKSADLEAFYDAKQTYSDNEVAIFLTGVGAYLMAQFMRGLPVDANTLKRSFEKWEIQNPQLIETLEQTSTYDPLIDDDAENAGINKDCWVNFQVELSSNLHAEEYKIRKAIRTTIYDQAQKYNGLGVRESGHTTSIGFSQLTDAIEASKQIYAFIDSYSKEQRTTGIYVKCALIETTNNLVANLGEYAQAVLQVTEENNITITESLKSAFDYADNKSYEFELIGPQLLKSFGTEVVLYKIVH